MIDSRDEPPAEKAEKVVNHMNLFFWYSMALQFVAAVAIFIGLVARGYRHHFGIWFTIWGWTTFASGYVIRSWIRRWYISDIKSNAGANCHGPEAPGWEVHYTELSMTRYLMLAACLVLVGCGRQGASQGEVSGKSEGIKNEATKRAETVRWAFANKREIESIIFQWSRDKMEEAKKMEGLSPEIEEKVRRYESLQTQLLRKQMEMRGLKLPPRAGVPEASLPDQDFVTLSNQVAEAKAPIAEIVDRRSRQAAENREQYKIDRLISEYAKDRFDLVVDSSDEHFSHSAVLYRTSGEVLDITDGVIKLFKEKTKS